MEKNLFFIVALIITFAGVYIRYCLRGVVSSDMVSFLLPWYNQIKEAGRFASLKESVGNYNVLYQFFIVLLTYLPVSPMEGYKLLSSVFDILCAVAGSLLALQLGKNKWQMLGCYSAILLSPVVFLNSAAWGQCDSIYTSFLLFSLLFLMKEEFGKAFLFLGIAFSAKLQAVFILPFFFFYYFTRKKFSILYFLEIPTIYFLSFLPALLAGRSFVSCLETYIGQTYTYQYMYMNYPSFWVIFSRDAYSSLSGPAIALTFTLLVWLFVICLRRKLSLTPENGIYLAFLTIYTCVLFLPAMHERYSFCFEILAIILAFIDKKTIIGTVTLIGLTCYTYSNYLFIGSRSLLPAAIVNLFVYVFYTLRFFKEAMPVSGDNQLSQNHTKEG